MRKKILFAAYSLDVGGIEKALVTLVNELACHEYDITIVLERKQGIFLKELNKNIDVVEYRVSENKNVVLRKIKNMLLRIKFSLKYKNKYAFSACYATYSLPSSFIGRIASKNNALWCHADYLTLYDNNENEMKKFFIQRCFSKFKHIVFVSNEGKKSFLKVFPYMESRVIQCNNLIDYKRVQQLARMTCSISRDENVCTFVNVGRHEEKQKKLTRLIEACEKLAKDNFKFRLLLVGDGPDNKLYRRMVSERNLENNVFFIGFQGNPYPFYSISDCVVLTSEYEGYPVVFLESFVLKKPIITTKVSDYSFVMDKYGYVTDKNSNDTYEKMKKFINEGYEIKEDFDPEKYNESILQKLNSIF